MSFTAPFYSVLSAIYDWFIGIFKSENSYFDQSDAKLSVNREKIRRFLSEMKGYSSAQINYYLTAYDYFQVNKLHYDGATMTEDLCDIENLELCSMLHDWMYIHLKTSGNLKYRLLSDKLFRSEMSRMRKSSWNRGYRFVALLIISLLHTPWSWLVKNRRMTRSQRIAFDGMYTTLYSKTPKVWYKEFWREILWIVILIFSLIFMIY